MQTSPTESTNTLSEKIDVNQPAEKEKLDELAEKAGEALGEQISRYGKYWCATFLAWLGIILLIIGIATGSITCYIFFVILYLLYLLIMCCGNNNFESLQKGIENPTIEEFLPRIFKDVPKISYTYNCYFDKKERNTDNTVKEVKESLYKETQQFPFFSARDISGKLVINQALGDKMFLKLRLTKRTRFADTESYYDFMYPKSLLYWSNDWRFNKVEFKEYRTLPSFQDYIVLRIKDLDQSQIQRSKRIYAILCFLTLGVFYLKKISNYFAKADFRIIKLISTRKNLLNEKQFDEFTPSIELPDRKIKLTPEETTYVNTEFPVPTESVEEKSKVYEDYIPKYKVANGIVSELPGCKDKESLTPGKFKSDPVWLQQIKELSEEGKKNKPNSYTEEQIRQNKGWETDLGKKINIAKDNAARDAHKWRRSDARELFYQIKNKDERRYLVCCKEIPYEGSQEREMADIYLNEFYRVCEADEIVVTNERFLELCKNSNIKLDKSLENCLRNDGH